MKYVVLVAALGLSQTGCPSEEGEGNGDTLFLAPDGVETELKLIEQEPPPF